MRSLNINDVSREWNMFWLLWINTMKANNYICVWKSVSLMACCPSYWPSVHRRLRLLGLTPSVHQTAADSSPAAAQTHTQCNIRTLILIMAIMSIMFKCTQLYHLKLLQCPFRKTSTGIFKSTQQPNTCFNGFYYIISFCYFVFIELWLTLTT